MRNKRDLVEWLRETALQNYGFRGEETSSGFVVVMPHEFGLSKVVVEFGLVSAQPAVFKPQVRVDTIVSKPMTTEHEVWQVKQHFVDVWQLVRDVERRIKEQGPTFVGSLPCKL